MIIFGRFSLILSSLTVNGVSCVSVIGAGISAVAVVAPDSIASGMPLMKQLSSNEYDAESKIEVSSKEL